jgi:undecaprenyl diphosphate synthase
MALPLRSTPGPPSLHVAVIMDGNGRWARARGLPREAGHRAGSAAVRRAVEAAADPAAGVGWLTLYAFSSDNWRRPPQEVAALLGLFGEYLRSETPRCVENGVRLGVIGRRDRLGAALAREVAEAESRTAVGTGLRLRLAIDYSSRDAILHASRRIAVERGPFSRERLARELAADSGAPDVDLLVRTGGERRLSDFLLWESAYAELVFLDSMWPDFAASDLHAALAEYRARDRRFGGLAAEGGTR